MRKRSAIPTLDEHDEFTIDTVVEDDLPPISLRKTRSASKISLTRRENLATSTQASPQQVPILKLTECLEGEDEVTVPEVPDIHNSANIFSPCPQEHETTEMHLRLLYLISRYSCKKPAHVSPQRDGSMSSHSSEQTPVQEKEVWIGRLPLLVLIYEGISMGVFPDYDYSPQSEYVGQRRVYLNISQEGKDDIDDCLEMGFLVCLKLSASGSRLVTAYRVSQAGTAMLDSLSAEKREELMQTVDPLISRQGANNLVQVEWHEDEDAFYLHAAEGFEPTKSSITCCEDVSYVSSPYLPENLLLDPSKLTSNRDITCGTGNNMRCSTSELITLRGVRVLIGEYIPFGSNHMVLLNDKVGSSERVQGGLMTSTVTHDDTKTQFEVDSCTTSVNILDFSMTSHLNFSVGLRSVSSSLAGIIQKPQMPIPPSSLSSRRASRSSRGPSRSQSRTVSRTNSWSSGFPTVLHPPAPAPSPRASPFEITPPTPVPVLVPVPLAAQFTSASGSARQAEVRFPEDEGIIQVENFGVHVNEEGSILYGLKMESIMDRHDLSLDTLARVLVDVHQDSSQIMDHLISQYQRELLECTFLGHSNARDKFNVIMAEEIHPKLPAEKYMDKEGYENELKQVIGDTFASYDLEDGVLVLGRHGILVTGAHTKINEDSIVRYLSRVSIDIFIRNFFNRIFILDEQLKEIARMINQHEKDPNSVVKIRDRIQKCVKNLLLLEEIHSYLEESLQVLQQGRTSLDTSMHMALSSTTTTHGPMSPIFSSRRTMSGHLSAI
eukprot:CAMPEP_0184664376 /NCGR_PEP_ID=MMETSP0308-20130426/52494_1 /TAXON_ID=38269 /ORGANISM="Gloeochaete witrockiana, Strain SAG 46.84" /LENGTH=776 /DNA_ID=CAMNT_0027107733 /DNA_START=154 /DNA_END=2481 /DNA_ORIENTATION=-